MAATSSVVSGSAWPLLAPLFEDRPATWQRVRVTFEAAPALYAFVEADEAVPGSMMAPDGSGGYVPVIGADLNYIHAKWRTMPEPRPRHPAAPLVDAWQRRPTHRQARALVNRGSLPRLSRLGADDATLPDFPLQDAPAAPGGQLDLPGFGDAVRGCANVLSQKLARSKS